MASSEINTILANSLSPDANLRVAAEQALSQAAENNFSLYLETLCTALADESAQPFIRQAAGLALKNGFTSRDYNRQQAVKQKWLRDTAPDTKAKVKGLVLQTLSSTSTIAGQAAAQVVAAIAAIELPRSEWPNLMTMLVQAVNSGADHQKQASLTTIGFICESSDPELRASLSAQSNAILTAVVAGARKEEPNSEIRAAAITALGDSLEFVSENFKHEGERNYIMQVVCEATQAQDSRIQQGAFGCLNRIMGLYYENMRFYMEKALFSLTILGMKNEDEDVAKLAVEFWSTVCEEELSIEDDNSQVENADQMRPFYNFARVAAKEVVPVILQLMTKQEEDASDDEYNLARAAYQCLSLYSQAVGNPIVPEIVQFTENNLRSENWRCRDAAVSAFGAMMEGPDEKELFPYVKQALNPLVEMMVTDPSVQVKDSAAYAIGRITENCAGAIDPATMMDSLIRALFSGLVGNPKMAASSCWALMNLVERFSNPDQEQERNYIAPHFNHSVSSLLDVTGSPNCDTSVRTAAYEVLNSFVQNAGKDNLQAVASLLNVIMSRLSETMPMQSQVVSVEDKITLEDMQTSLCAVLQAIITRLDSEIVPQGDNVMRLLLQLLSARAQGASSVPEAVFGAISALANAVEGSFAKYMDSFKPFLYNALGNQEERGLCSMAIGLVSDITRSIGEASQPYCNDFMNYLLNNLQSPNLSNQFKPAILQTFGDIASAIGGHFEPYLSVVGQVLDQAASVTVGEDSPFELCEYVLSLREGIMDAWSGIIGAMKISNKTHLLQPYVQPIMQLLSKIYGDHHNRSEALMRATMGVIGDLCDAFPNQELGTVMREDWLTLLIKQTKQNREYSSRTIEVARWAREQIKAIA